MPQIEPTRFTDGPPLLLAGLRRWHGFGDAATTVPAQWAEFARLGTLPGQRGRVAYGAVCQSAPERQAFEYLAGVEVASLEGLPGELGRMRVPPAHYAVFTHRGHVSGLRQTWDAIWNDWLPRSGRQPASTPDFERYGEDFDARTGTGTVEIWFPLAPAGG